MLIRDKLNNSQKWTSLLRKFIDLESGKPLNVSGQQKWQGLVLDANRATIDRLKGNRPKRKKRSIWSLVNLIITLSILGLLAWSIYRNVVTATSRTPKASIATPADRQLHLHF